MPHIVAALLVLAACTDQRAGGDAVESDALASDSALARDLTLAGTPPAPDAPATFNDTAGPEQPDERPAVIPAPATERAAAARSRSTPRATTVSQRGAPDERPAVPRPSQPAEAPPIVPPVVPPAVSESAAVASGGDGAGRSRGAIGAGSVLSFTTTSRMCSSTNAPGDKIVATLDAPAAGTRGFTLPAGTTKAVLEMASVDRDAEGNPTGIVFRVRNLDDGASTYQATGEVTTTDSLRRTRAKNNPSADRRKVVGGAVIGAVLGQVLGKDTKGTVIGAAAGGAAGAVTVARGARFEGCLPEGAKVTLRLAEPILQ